MEIDRTCPVCEQPFKAHRVRQVCCRSICIVRERNRRQRDEPVSDREWYPFKENLRRQDGLKTCPQCKEDLPADEKHFHRIRGSERFCSWCIKCGNKKSLHQRRRERLELLQHYGGDPPTCACCKEGTLEFLCIDHIDGGGNKHRAELRSTSGSNFYGWLRRNGFPPGFRVLCHNCNLARGFYGQCPHERSST